MAKKLLALFLVVLMNIESFASVIGDSDGNAFLTKKDFEKMKSEFGDTMNRYASSIDEKISGAITEYLKGIPLKERKGRLLFEYDKDSENRPLCVEDGYNTIDEQTFQGGVMENILWSAHSININSFLPMGFDAAISGNYPYNFTLFTLLGRGYYDQMVGWVFSDDDNVLLESKYNYDNCRLNMSFQSTGNLNFGTSNAGERFMMGIAPGFFTGKEINTRYTTKTGVGKGNNGGFRLYDAWRWTTDTLQPADVKEKWLDGLPLTSAMGTGKGFDEWRQMSTYNENTISALTYITHSKRDEDQNIYLYNKCHDVIYAHAKEEKELEEYVDYMDKIDASADKDDKTIGGKQTNVFISNRTEKWAYWAPYYKDGAYDLTQWSDGFIVAARRTWRFTPKFKLKNTTTNTKVKPNTASVTGGTLIWNTLDQFKNTKLKFTDWDGNAYYPRFYGGLPLVSLGSETIEKLRFDIKITADASTGTHNYVRLQVKKGEFPNSNDLTSWTASEIDDLETNISGEYGSTTYSYDESNHYLQIPFDKLTSISIMNPSKQTTYFLRYWLADSSDIAGGQIADLGNCVITGA